MATSRELASGLSMLVGILKREKRDGLETVTFSPASQTSLREIPGQIRIRRTAPSPSPAPTPFWAAQDSPPAAKSAPSVNSPVTANERSEVLRRQELNAIFKQVKNAPEPRALGSLFETVVFAAGNPCAEILFVGEAPGAEEEKQRKPFVGPAGQKLDQILKAMGLQREDVYISNIVKFRPKKGDGRFQGSSNRAPSEEEMATCLPYIRAEIEVVRPRVIVALGLTAAEGLLEKGGSLANFRNVDYSFSGIPVVVTYHPSYLLRQEAASAEEGKRAKRQVWEDMLLVMERAALPISDKQRRYFL